MAGKILFVLTEWGYWGEECTGPYNAVKEAGYEPVLLTPTGKRPTVLGVSLDPTYVDPPLARPVTTAETAKAVAEVEKSGWLDKPMNLSEWFPLRPYFSSSSYVRDMEHYYDRLDALQKDIAQYDSMVIVGGSGAMVDLANNQRLHDLIMGFLKQDKPVAAECYGVACFAFARSLEDRKSLIWGRHVTGHCIEYDYKDGTGFTQTGSTNFGPPFYPLEYILRDAVGPNGQYHGNVGRRTSVIVDYPFVTSRSTAESYECGQVLVQVLKKGLRRYGW